MTSLPLCARSPAQRHARTVALCKTRKCRAENIASAVRAWHGYSCWFRLCRCSSLPQLWPCILLDSVTLVCLPSISLSPATSRASRHKQLQIAPRLLPQERLPLGPMPSDCPHPPEIAHVPPAARPCARRPMARVCGQKPLGPRLPAAGARAASSGASSTKNCSST